MHGRVLCFVSVQRLHPYVRSATLDPCRTLRPRVRAARGVVGSAYRTGASARLRSVVHARSKRRFVAALSGGYSYVAAHRFMFPSARSMAHASAASHHNASRARGVLVPEAKRTLDVRVTRGSVQRALRIVDALMKGLEARGFAVACATEDERRTSVKVLDEDIGFCLEERVRQVERKEPPRRPSREPFGGFLSPYPRYDYVPSGELALRLTDDDFQCTRRTWRDGKRSRLEPLLNRFIVGLVGVVGAKKVERQRREEREKEWQRRRRDEAEQQRLRWEEEKKIRLLKEDLAAWRSSCDIREYLAAARTNAELRCMSDEQRRELDEWLRWVADYADRLDPALSATPPKDPWT